MKFHATVVIEFGVHDIGEVGKRLNELREVAEEHELKTRSIELFTAQGTPVTLPAVGPVTRTWLGRGDVRHDAPASVAQAARNAPGTHQLHARRPLQRLCRGHSSSSNQRSRPTEELMSGRIVHIEIPADDTAASREFWSSLLGWTFESYPGPSDYHMARLSETQGGAITNMEPGKRGTRPYFVSMTSTPAPPA